MPEDNIANLLRGHAAFNRGDASVAIELSTPDVEWGATGAFPGVEGLYRGPEAIQEWTDAIRSAWSAFEVTLEEVHHESEDLIVVTEHLRGRGRESGADVDMRVFSVYWFTEGKIAKRAAFTERDAALAAAGVAG